MSSFEIWIVSLTILYVTTTLALVIIGVRQIKRMEQQIRVQNMWSLMNANREIIKLEIEHPELLFTFRLGQEQFVETAEIKSRCAQLWINQMHAIWYSFKHGHIENEQLMALKRDVGWSFQDPIIKERWNVAYWAYATDFQQFVTEAIDECTAKTKRSSDKKPWQRDKDRHVVKPEFDL